MNEFNCIIAIRTFKHLTVIQRGRIEELTYDHTYYDCYLADEGVHVYHENRQYSRAKEHHKILEEVLPRGCLKTFFQGTKSRGNKCEIARA